MFIQKRIISAGGTSSIQEIYDWMTENCADLFDSITVSEDQLSIYCNVENTQLLTISASSTGNGQKICWKGNVYSTMNYGDSIRIIYRINNGVFFQKIPNSINSTFKNKCIPTNGIIKTSSDYMGIFFSYSDQWHDGENYAPHIKMTSGTSIIRYVIHSKNNGLGSMQSISISNYYDSLSDKIVLTPMVCTCTGAPPTEIAYWLKGGLNRDIGLITIGGNEYFSNGVFCILNE